MARLTGLRSLMLTRLCDCDTHHTGTPLFLTEAYTGSSPAQHADRLISHDRCSLHMGGDTVTFYKANESV
jgi:hypothetical protein